MKQRKIKEKVQSPLTQQGLDPPNSHLRAFLSSPSLPIWEIFPPFILTQVPSPAIHHFNECTVPSMAQSREDTKRNENKAREKERR